VAAYGMTATGCLYSVSAAMTPAHVAARTRMAMVDFSS